MKTVKAMTRRDEIRELEKEERKLTTQVREYEAWLPVNTDSANFTLVLENYNQALFMLNQKREKIATLKSDCKVYNKTISLPQITGRFNQH